MFPFLLLWGSVIFFIGAKTAENNAMPKTVYQVKVDYEGRAHTTREEKKDRDYPH